MFTPLLFAQLLTLPAPPQIEPVFSRPAVIREQGPSPEWFRRDPQITFGLARSQLGTQIRVSPTAGVAFTLDVLAGAFVRFGRVSRWGATFEAGYSYVGFSEHLAVTGIGLVHSLPSRSNDDGDDAPSSMSTRMRVAIALYGVGGVSESRGALGFRGQISIGPSFALFSIGYQFVQTDAINAHELRFTFSSLSLFGARS